MLTSRKWKAVLIDAIFSICLLVVTYWVNDPKWQEFVLKLLPIIQAVVVAYILGTAYEDGQEKRAVTYTDGSVPTMPYPDNITSNLEGPG